MKTKKNQKTDFPGYPLYPPSEDITQRAKKTNMDPENPNEPKSTNSGSDIGPLDDQEPKQAAKSEFDLTDEDMEALGPRDLSMDMGEDEELKHRTTPVDFSGEDLDVPGSESDDEQEKIGSEDEENNNYSIGGDRHENLEEDPS